jgi:hypothetical protein
MVMALCFVISGHCSQVLTFSENQRLKASIAPDVLNRMAALQDRIAQVFGDEGTFVTQTDDNTGQVFIKPTAENGAKPIALTLITESGLTQDLTLNPVAKESATILLKNELKESAIQEDPVQHSVRGYDDPTSSYKGRILFLLKKTALGAYDTLSSCDDADRPAPDGYRFVYQGSLTLGGLRCVCYQVIRESTNARDLQESDFYQMGDVALALRSSDSVSSGTTQLLSIRRDA